MPSLSASQIAAAQSLASGMSLIRSSKVAGVDRRTVQRWQKQEAFTREVRDRRALNQAGERLDEARQVSPSGFNLAAAISDLREAKKATRLRVREAGSSILQKCCERLQDLPIEAISPQLLPTFFRVGHELVQWADEREAEELELSELTECLLRGSDSLVGKKAQLKVTKSINQIYQEIADSPEFPDDVKQKIFETLSRPYYVSDRA
jgi:hypothetical protein